MKSSIVSQVPTQKSSVEAFANIQAQKLAEYHDLPWWNIRKKLSALNVLLTYQNEAINRLSRVVAAVQNKTGV